MSIKIYDNVLPENMFRNIRAHFTGPLFPWYFNEAVVYSDQKEFESNLNFQFVHTLYRDNTVQSPSYDILQPLFTFINPFQIIKLKVNCNPYNDHIYESGMHVDINPPKSTAVNTAIFYLNTNNGYTKIEKTGQKIESIENRLVVFDSKTMHSGSTTNDSKARFVINLNYIPR